jgi:hypothetical protein
MYNAAIWIHNDDLKGTGRQRQFRTYAECVLWLANEADSLFSHGETPEIACAHVGPGFAPTPRPVDSLTLYDDVSGLMLFPRAERQRALDALAVATDSFVRGAH